jgi:hypothetical protein
MGMQTVARIVSYKYNRPYTATYQVVKGKRIASMVSDWSHDISPRCTGWVFDLRNLDKGVRTIDFRLTNEKGVWQGRIPRADMPAKFVSFSINERGMLKATGKYADYFQKVA